jgi:hypothetical protein
MKIRGLTGRPQLPPALPGRLVLRPMAEKQNKVNAYEQGNHGSILQ